MDKRCRKCGEVKPLDDFHKSKSAPDGHQYRCKSCAITGARQWALDHPEAHRAADKKYGVSAKCKTRRKARREGPRREVILAQKRTYHHAHKDAINAKIKLDRAKNPEKFLAWSRACYVRNHQRILDQHHAWNEDHRAERRIYNRRRDFGLTHERFVAMMGEQQELCAICGIHMETIQDVMPNGRRRTGINVDHDHVTGKVRALLCSRCNKGLGQFLDSPTALRAAADYLESHAV